MPTPFAARAAPLKDSAPEENCRAIEAKCWIVFVPGPWTNSLIFECAVVGSTCSCHGGHESFPDRP